MRLVISFAEVFPAVREREARKSGQVKQILRAWSKDRWAIVEIYLMVSMFLSGLIYSLKPPPRPLQKKNQTHVERKSFLLNLHRINCLTPAIINQMEFKREVN